MNILDFRKAVFAAQQNVAPTETTWSGLGSTDNWSLTTNWVGNNVPINNNSLIFGGSTRLTPTNDISSFSVNNITFPAAAGAFSISGIAFTKLDNSYITNNSSNAQSISNAIALSPGTAGGIINSNTAAITLSGVISGANRLIKNGANTLTVSGNNTYSGSTVINEGTVKAGNINAFGSGSITLNNAAILDLNGTYNFPFINLIDNANSKIINSGVSVSTNFGNITVNSEIDDSMGGAISLILGIDASTPVVTNVNNKIRGGIYIPNGSATVANLNVGSFGTGNILIGNVENVPSLIYNGSAHSNVGARNIEMTNGSAGFGGGAVISNNGTGVLTLSGVFATPGTLTKLLTLSGANSGNNTVAGIIANSTSGTDVVSLEKQGVGKWILGSQSNSYTGSTAITAGTLVAYKGIATGSFTALPLITDFSSTPSIGQTYRFFPGSTVQRYYSSNRSNGVIFTDSGDLVTSTSHGLPNGTAVYFSAIAFTTGISINTRYYIVNATTNDFQLSASVGGTALPFTTSATTASAVMALSTSIGSVGFVDTTNLVTLDAHGLTNGTAIYFSSIASTTGISINTVYYVISSTTNNFQLAATVGGSIIDLVTDGTGVLCKNPIVSLTNASGNIGSYSSNNSTLSVIGQLGADIVGPQFAQAGLAVDINAAGDVIAFGCPASAGVSSKVFVYAWDGTAWVQRGATFSGLTGEYLGYDVSLNADGTVVAMSTGAGDSVKVYAWNGTSWTQRGATFVAASGEGSLGYSISLNAVGDRIAIGAPNAQLGTGQGIGLVKVYSWNSTSWVQLGSTFTGSTVTPINSRVGTKVVLNNTGDRVLITSNGDATSKGLARIYSYSGSSWSQLGNDIIGAANGEQLGIASASMNAVGDIVALSSIPTSKVKVYSLISSTWTQLGSDIVEVNNNYFGRSVSLNDAGNRIAIGEIYFGDAISSRGRTRIYDFSSSTWSQFGADILGNSASNFSGSDVALNSSGDRIIVGAPTNSASGYVQAFQI